MRESRIVKSSYNAIFGVLYQIVVLVFSFVSRTIFIKILGSEYLGISGLFSNILTVLSLAELGFGTAINYSLYKPIAEHDVHKIAALMNFFKKVYYVVAAIVLSIGLSLVPVLSYLVNVETDIPNLTLYYILILMQTVVSYLFVYKMAILNANQQGYLVSNYGIFTYILQFVLQNVMLVITRNFAVYLGVQILCTLINNLLISRKADLIYPELKYKACLEKAEKIEIFRNVKDLFLYKIGAVILNGTDNILISTLVGTVWVGIYSNYLMLVNAIKGFVTIVFNAMQASIGNLSVKEDIDTQFRLFKVLDLLCFVCYGFCAICFWTLLDKFIFIWLGSDFLLEPHVVAIVVFNFYIPGILSITAMYRDATGMFKQTKYIFLTTAFINLILSIILGKIWGLTGILAATLIARLCTNFWFEPFVIYKHYFKRNICEYFVNQIVRIIFIAILVGLYSFIFNFIPLNIGTFLIESVVCGVGSIIAIWLYIRRKEEYSYIYENLIKKVLVRMKIIRR